MFRKNKDEKVFRYSIRKYHFGAASVAVAALMFLGVRAEVVKANTSLDVAQATLGSSDSATGQSDEASRAVASTPVSAPTTASSETTPAEAETSATKVDKTKLRANYDKLRNLIEKGGLQGEALEDAKTLASKVQSLLADDSASAETVEKTEKVLEEVLVAIENSLAKKAEESKSETAPAEAVKAEGTSEKKATTETETPAVAEEAQTTEAKAKLQVSLGRLEKAIAQTPDHDLTRDILEKALAQVSLAKAVLENAQVSLREIEDMNRAVKKSEGSVMIAQNRLTSGRNDKRNRQKIPEGVQFRAEVAVSDNNQNGNASNTYILNDVAKKTDPKSANDYVSRVIQYKTQFNKDPDTGKIISVDWLVFFNNHAENLANAYGTDGGDNYLNYLQIPEEVLMPQNIERIQYAKGTRGRIVGGRLVFDTPKGALSDTVTFDNSNPNKAAGLPRAQYDNFSIRDWPNGFKGRTIESLRSRLSYYFKDAASDSSPGTKALLENAASTQDRVISDRSTTGGNNYNAYVWKFRTLVPDSTTNERLQNMKVIFGMMRSATVGANAAFINLATNPANLSAADVAKDFTPVTPAKTPVANPSQLSPDDIAKIKTAVEGANKGKKVTVAPTGKATVTDPTTNISHDIPATDLVVQDFTPVTPAKTPVANPSQLSPDDIAKIKTAVEGANKGKKVTVAPTGKATVTDPTTNISHDIPATDLVVQDFTPVTPAKTPVANPSQLSPDDIAKIKTAVEGANKGKKVTVAPTGKATVTDPTTNISHDIPATDLVVQDFTPVTPAKTPVANPSQLSPDDIAKIKTAVEGANKGKKVTVAPTGKATVTDPTTNISHDIPATDLVVQDFTPVTPAKTPVANPSQLSPDDIAKIKTAVEGANKGKKVTVAPTGKATVTDPTTNISHDIPATDLVVQDFTPVTPAKTPVANPSQLSPDDIAKIKTAVEGANKGKKVTVAPTGKATVTDPTTNISHDIPATDLVVQDFTPVTPAKTPVANPSQLSPDDIAKIKTAVEGANKGKKVTVAPTGKATVTDPTTNISHDIPATDLVVQDFTPVTPAKTPVANPSQLSPDDIAKIKTAVEGANKGKKVTVAPTGKATVTDPTTNISHDIPATDLVVQDFTPVTPAKTPVANPSQLSPDDIAKIKTAVEGANKGKKVTVAPTGKATVTDPTTNISHDIPATDLVVQDFTPVTPAKTPVANPSQLSPDDIAKIKTAVEGANKGKKVTVAPTGKATVTDPTTNISHDIPATDLVVQDFTPVTPAKTPVANPSQLSPDDIAKIKTAVEGANKGKKVTVAPTGKATVTDPTTNISHDIPATDLVVQDFTPVTPAKTPVANPSQLSPDDIAKIKTAVEGANKGKKVTVAPTGKATVTDPTTNISHDIPATDLVVQDFTPVTPAKTPVANPSQLSPDDIAKIKTAVEGANKGKKVTVAPTGKATVTDPTTNISHDIPATDLVVQDFTPVTPAKTPVANPSQLSPDDIAKIKTAVEGANKGKKVTVAPTGKATVTDPTTNISHDIPATDLVVQDFTPVTPAKTPVANPSQLSPDDIAKIKTAVEGANKGKKVTVAPTGKATVTDPTTNISHDIPATDLVVQDFTPVTPAKTPVANPSQLSPDDIAKIKTAVEGANKGKKVTVAPTGKATVTDPTTNISHDIPATDLVVQDFTPVTPAKTPVANPSQLSPDDIAKIKTAVEGANKGKKVTVAPTGKATVTDPTTNISHDIPATDLVVQDFTPVTPAKTPVANPSQLSPDDIAKIKTAVEGANKGKKVTVAPTGKATVTDPTTNISHDIPATDLVVQDFTPVTPAKTPVANPSQLSPDDIAKIKTAVEGANKGKKVTVAPTGKATVTDPTTNISHDIPATDLVVQDFTPVTPAKTPVANPSQLSPDDIAKIKTAVEGANKGKKVTVAPTGKATVTDPTTNISHDIPATDLVVQDFTPVTPAKTPVANPSQLSPDDIAKIKTAVEGANKGKKVTVAPTGKATVTDPTTNISHDIPATDLVVQDFTPVTPAKTPVANPSQLSPDDIAKIKTAVEGANKGKKVTVAPTGKATVTDPTTNISHDIPATDLVVQDFTPVTPAKTPVANPSQLSPDDIAKIKTAVEGANKGKKVTVAPTGKATVTDPTTNISHDIPATDLVVQDFTPVTPAKTPVANPSQLSPDDIAKIKTAVEGANKGKKVTVAPTGKATVTDPTTNISHDIPATDLVVQDFTPVTPAKTPVANPSQLSPDDIAKIKTAVEGANKGKKVTVAPTGKATVTDPTTNISHDIPATDLVVQDFTPVTPAKTPVANPSQLSPDDIAKIKTAVEGANKGKKVTVAPTGKATVTDPTTNISHDIPATDLVVQDFTPVTPAKTPVANPSQLSPDDIAKIKTAVEGANKGKKVTVAPTGKATVTDPTTNISHDIPATDLVVQDFTPVTPAKTPVANPSQLSPDDIAKIKTAVEGANKGKKVTVAPTGKATVTDPTTNISHDIPATDLVVQDFTPVTPAKTPVANPSQLSPDDIAKIKTAVEGANKGKKVTVAPTGKATVTDPTTNISHDIPATDLVVQDFTPVTPAKTPVANPSQLSPDDIAKIKTAVEGANKGKKVTVAPTGKATVTDPTTNISHDIPATDLVVQDFTPVTPAKTPVANPSQLSPDDIAKIKTAVEGANKGKKVTVAPTGKATVTDPTTNISHDIPATDLVVQDFTPVTPAKTEVKDPAHLTDKEKEAVKDKVEKANPGKNVTVDDQGNATVTDPTNGSSATIPSSDLVEKAKEETPVTPVKPVTPAKTEVKDPAHLTDKEKEAVKDKVEKANPGKNVTVDDQGNATVTDPTNGSSATIPSSDLVEKAKEETPVTPVKPVTPAKTEVKDPAHLTDKEKEAVKDKVEKANPGKNVTVDDQGNATVTDPTNGSSATIPSSDLVEKAKEETPVTPVKPVTPAKTEVKDPAHLTDKEKEAVKDKVEKANPGKNVTVDDQGNATVTDPTNGSSATIPSSDLVEKAKEETPVTPVKPVTPAKTEVKDPAHLTDKEKEAVKDKVEKANPGKNVTVDDQGNATVTDPTNGSSATIPSSDLVEKAKEETPVTPVKPVTPAKTEVKDPAHLTDKEKEAVKDKVEKANPGKNVTVDDQGNATVTDPTNGSSATIPSSDLVEKAKEETPVTPVKPVTPAKTEVKDPAHLTDKEKEAVKDKVEKANPGKNVTVDDQGNATVTDPTNGSSATIPSSDLVEKAKEETPVTPVKPVTPAKTEVKDPAHLTDKEKEAVKDKVEKANPGKNVTVDDQGNATVTDPTNGSSATIPSSDLVEKAKEETPVTPVKPVTPAKTEVKDPAHLTDKEKEAVKDKVEKANPGKNVTVDDQGNATVTDPTNGSSATIPSSDLVEKAKEETPVTPVKPVTPAKTEVKDPAHLTDKEKEAVKDKVEKANPGKNVTVDDQGNATVTDPTNGSSATIPSSDLVEKAKEETPVTPVKPVTPAKTEVKDPAHLTDKEKEAVKDKVEKANPGKNVTVDDQGNATVTDPTNGSSATIPSSDLVEKAKEETPVTPVKPVTPAKTEVKDPAHLTDKEKEAVKDKVEKANPGKNVTVDDQGNATVTDPTNGSSATIPSSDLVEKAKEETPVTPVKPVTPAKTEVKDPAHLTDKEKEAVKDKVEKANPGKNVTVDDQGNATVTDPTNGSSATIPSSDLVEKAKEETPVTPVKPVTPAKTEVKDPAHLTDKEKEAVKDKVEKANPGKNVTVDDQGNATVTDPTNGSSATIPSSDLVEKAKEETPVTPVKPVTPAKTEVKDPAHLTDKEKEAVKDKVEKANPGKNVTVDDQGNATVTDPTNGSSATIPSSDLVEKAKEETPVTPVKPVTPAKTEVKDPAHLTDKEKEAVKDKVEKANPGKNVTVDDQGNATVTDPTNGSSATIPSSDLVEKAKEETPVTPVKPVTPAKTEVKDPAHLTDKEKEAVKDKVEKANPGKNVTVDDQGNATVTDPTNGSSATIPSSDLVEKAKEETPVTPVKPVTPAKTEVKDPAHLTDKEKEAVKDKVEKANPGKNVTVDDQGNATVTDPTNGSSATIPSSDLVEKAKEETPVTPVKPVTPAKTEVKDPAHLTDKEKEAVKDKVEKANPGKNVTVDDQGNATVTDPTNGSSATIPSSDLVEKAKEETPVTPVKPVTPAKTEVKDPAHLTDKEKEAVKDKVEKANPGKNVTVDDQGNATVTDPTNGSSATIPSSDLVEKAKEETPVTPVKPVTPAKTEVKDPAHLTDKEKEAVKDKVEKANPGKNVTVDDQGNATVTDPTNGSSATIPSSDLVEKAKEETPVTPVKPVTPAKTEVKDPAHLTDKEKEAVKDKVEKANPGKNVTVDDQGNATVTDPTNGSSATIPSSDLVEKAKEETPVTPVKPVTPANDQATAQTNTRRAAKELPNTGTADSAVSMVAAAASALIGLGFAGRRRKEDEE